MDNINMYDFIWKRIIENQGKPFHQIKGNEFHYEVSGNTIIPDKVNRKIPRSDIEKALKLVPFVSTTVLNRLQAPSYIYAILMDERISGKLW